MGPPDHSETSGRIMGDEPEQATTTAPADRATRPRAHEEGVEPPGDAVFARLTGQFAPAYLTLASIIQGVALAALAQRVEATYAGFDAAAWLLTLATFLIFLIVWHEYVLQVLAFVWLPTMLDTVVPFTFLAAELLLAHCIYRDLRLWLLALGLVGIAGMAAALVSTLQTRAFPENRAIVRALAPHHRVHWAVNATIVALSLGAWALYDALRLGQAQLGVALVAPALALAWIGGVVPYGKHLRAYARGDRRADP